MKKDRLALETMLLTTAGEPFPMRTITTRIEHYIESERMKALGWMHSFACVAADNNQDIRDTGCDEIIERFREDLNDGNC